MASVRPRLTATPRRLTGKAVARLRRQGLLPAVLYGRHQPSLPLALDARAFDHLRAQVAPTTLVELAVEGGATTTVLIHDVQIHPVTRRPLHVDLLAVEVGEELTVEVPLVPVGASPAVEDHGGTLFHPIDALKVRARAEDLPTTLPLELGRLVDFDAVIHARDVPLPPGVTLVSDPDEVVAKVLPPRVEEAPPPAPAPAPAAAAPGTGAGESTSPGRTGGEGSAEGTRGSAQPH
jgi:large subunit ribosomal protein L25